MGVPVRGTEVRSAIFPETTYGVIPGSPVGELLYLRTNGLSASVTRTTDPTLSGRRGQPKSVKNEKDLRGTLSATIAAESICQLLKHLVGTPVAYRPAFNVAAALNVGTTITPGIRILRANALTTPGTGSLTFTLAGTLLTWTAPGGSAGTPVNIAAGGDFALPGSAANTHLYVRVTAGSLPGSNLTDAAIVVHNAYEHVFVVGSDIPTGFIVENYLGTKIATASERYQRFLGNRMASAAINIAATGISEISFEAVGADYNTSATALDGTLDDFGHKGFSNLDGLTYVNGVLANTLTSLQVNWGNDLDEDGRTIGSGGVRSMLESGFVIVGGRFNALFDSSDFLVLSRAETEVAILQYLRRGTGAGTAGNEAFGIDLPRNLITERTPAVPGPRGLRVDWDFNAHRPDTAEYDGVMFVRNQRATI